MTTVPVSAASCAPRQSDFAAALLDPERPGLAGLRTWNGSDPAPRLAVYRNNVMVSLVDALANTFPVVLALVGEDFFNAMASVFVRRSPPTVPILAHYGRDFPAFVDGFEPARALPYLADVARLELARVRAFHAADAGAVAESAVHAALAAGERAGELLLGLHPSVAVVDSTCAVVSIWAAHQGDGDLAAVDPHSPEAAIVLRQDLDVLVLRAGQGVAGFVIALLAGHDLGAATDATLSVSPAFDLQATLALLLAHGALTSIQLPGSATA